MRCLALLRGEHHHGQRQPVPGSSRVLSPSHHHCLLPTGSWANSHSQAGKKIKHQTGHHQGGTCTLLAKGITVGLTSVCHASAEEPSPPSAPSQQFPPRFIFSAFAVMVSRQEREAQQDTVPLQRRFAPPWSPMNFRSSSILHLKLRSRFWGISSINNKDNTLGLGV